MPRDFFAVSERRLNPPSFIDKIKINKNSTFEKIWVKKQQK